MGGEPRVFRTPGEYEFSHVVVRGVMMTPLPEGAPHEQRNVAYAIEMDGISVCHLGDLTRPLTTRQVEELKPVHVALVPAGGQCTLSLDQALQTIQDLDPKVVVPMHFGHGQEGVTLDSVGAVPAPDGAGGRDAAAAPAGGHSQQPSRRPAREPAHPAAGVVPAGRAREGAATRGAPYRFVVSRASRPHRRGIFGPPACPAASLRRSPPRRIAREPAACGCAPLHGLARCLA